MNIVRERIVHTELPGRPERHVSFEGGRDSGWQMSDEQDVRTMSCCAMLDMMYCAAPFHAASLGATHVPWRSQANQTPSTPWAEGIAEEVG